VYSSSLVRKTKHNEEKKAVAFVKIRA